ncbi:glycosyltransferase family 2 protein [Larkinella humicola]|uniref:Glycosyltransferase family 2 protein n=1 Tax=Larkinella humicola TaxID=2607654 RepID=A0A5N1J160_9BACT|nr:glycosyltransferase family 2 protein [Larkinella humicola]KAA9340435.1 glycosyltransferase family 2 protein [Larkinella humicola]
MKVSGFSFIRNALQYDYPIVEAIQSILPLCDEFVIAVGRSEDQTLRLIQSIQSDKIRIIETVWDDSLREGGRVLAVETDKALAAIAPDADWAFYIQGDEVVHEKYLPAIREAMKTYKEDAQVEGLLLNYQHFYGSYRYVGDSRRWYRREVRIIRNNGNVVAYRDAQGFRTRDNRKLNVKLLDATVYHYGWVKPPDRQADKLSNFGRYWHNDEHMAQSRKELKGFDYRGVDSLALFDGTHPAVMQARIERMNWQFDFDIRQKKLSFKNRFLKTVENLTGWRIGEYRNYKLL